MPIGIQDKSYIESLNDFMDRLKEDREVIQEPVIPEPEPMEVAEELPGVDDTPDPVLERKKMEVAMFPAKTVVDVIDTTAVSINSYIAGNAQPGATKEEKESLQDAVANYMRETDIDLPPGKLLLVLIIMIYAPKTLLAFQVRKENKEKERLEARNAFLEQQLKQKEAANAEISSV